MYLYAETYLNNENEIEFTGKKKKISKERQNMIKYSDGESSIINLIKDGMHHFHNVF